MLRNASRRATLCSAANLSMPPAITTGGGTNPNGSKVALGDCDATRMTRKVQPSTRVAQHAADNAAARVWLARFRCPCGPGAGLRRGLRAPARFGPCSCWQIALGLLGEIQARWQCNAQHATWRTGLPDAAARHGTRTPRHGTARHGTARQGSGPHVRTRLGLEALRSPLQVAEDYLEATLLRHSTMQLFDIRASPGCPVCPVPVLSGPLARDASLACVRAARTAGHVRALWHERARACGGRAHVCA